MPVKKISELTSGTALSGAEKIPAVQGGDTVYTTPDAIATKVKSALGLTSTTKTPITTNTVLPATASGLYTVNAAGGSVQITLPSASTWAASLLSQKIVITRLDTSSNSVSVVAPGGNTMQGGTTYIAAGSSASFDTDNASVWYPINSAVGGTPKLGLIASRCGFVTSSNTSNYQTFSRISHALMDDADSLVLLYSTTSLGNVGSELNAGGNITFKVSLEVGGSLIPVTFGGNATVTISPGSVVASDPVPLRKQYRRGFKFFERVFTTSSWGIVWDARRGPLRNLSSGTLASSGDYFTFGTTTTDYTDTLSLPGFTGDNGVCGAVAIVGMTTRPALLLPADSRGYGQNELLGGGQNYAGAMGNTARRLAKSFAVLNAGVPGDTMQGIAAASGSTWGVRAQLVPYCTHAVVSMGINDFSNGRTAVQVATDLQTFATNKLGGMPVWACTVEPNTTSSDGWITTTNQTPAANNPERILYNDMLRAGIAGVAGCVEIADQVESARNSGLWKAPTRTLSDAAIDSGSNLLNSASAKWSTDDIGKGLVVSGAGAGGASMGAYIQSINSTTQAVLAIVASTTVASGGTVRFLYTGDGLHANKDGMLAIENSTAFDPLIAALS